MLALISWCFLTELSSNSEVGEGPRNAGRLGPGGSFKEGPRNPKRLRVGPREPMTGGCFIGGPRGGPRRGPRGFSAGGGLRGGPRGGFFYTRCFQIK